MQNITSAESLKNSILFLELRQKEEGKLLKEQFTVTYESLRPINVIHKMINDISGPSEIKDELIQTASGLITGYFSRKLLVRSSKNPFLRLAGVFLQYGVTNLVVKNSSTLKSIGQQFLGRLTDVFKEHRS